MSPALALLVGSVVAAADAPPKPVLDQVLAAWGPQVVDVRQSRQLTDGERATLAELGAEYESAGFELYVVLVDAVGPRFSLGDLTNDIRSATRCRPDCVYLTAHSGTLHSSSDWYSYKEARVLATELHADYVRAPIATLVRYGRELMEEGRRRTRHRRLMLAVAAAALCGLAGVLARARFRSSGSTTPST